MESVSAFAAMVKASRQAKGLRQAASEAGISPATLSRIERGKLPDVLSFRAVCKWAQFDPAWALEHLDRKATL